jgi:hypothetical protein
MRQHVLMALFGVALLALPLSAFVAPPTPSTSRRGRVVVRDIWGWGKSEDRKKQEEDESIAAQKAILARRKDKTAMNDYFNMASCFYTANQPPYPPCPLPRAAKWNCLCISG